ncbi:MAG: hypothetical protein AAF629_34255, partial [Chloroflexota bacterium]
MKIITEERATAAEVPQGNPTGPVTGSKLFTIGRQGQCPHLVLVSGKRLEGLSSLLEVHRSGLVRCSEQRTVRADCQALGSPAFNRKGIGQW